MAYQFVLIKVSGEAVIEIADDRGELEAIVLDYNGEYVGFSIMETCRGRNNFVTIVAPQDGERNGVCVNCGSTFKLL